MATNKPWSRSLTKAKSRDAFFRSGLSVRLDSEGQLQIRCRTVFRRELREVLKEIERKAKAIVHADHHITGALESSIEANRNLRQLNAHRLAGTVSAGGPRAPYARWVHEGHRAHIRTAKPGKFYVFKWTNRVGRVARSYPGEGLDESVVKGKRGLKFVPLVYSRGPRKGQQKMYSEWTTGPLADKTVRVEKVHMSARRPSRFLHQAAAATVAGRGGKVLLPRRSG